MVLEAPFSLYRSMAVTKIHDGYITNVLADTNTQLGAFTDVKTNQIIVVGKTEERNNSGNVYLQKAGGTVQIPIESGEVISIKSPAVGAQFNLGQWEIKNTNANDGCGYLAIAFVVVNTGFGLTMIADFEAVLAEWPTTFTFGGSSFSGYLGEVSEESTVELGGITPEYDAELYVKQADFSTPLNIGDELTVTDSYDTLLVNNKYRVHTRLVSDGKIISYGLRSLSS